MIAGLIHDSHSIIGEAWLDSLHFQGVLILDGLQLADHCAGIGIDL